MSSQCRSRADSKKKEKEMAAAEMEAGMKMPMLKAL
jgi:hypothetical protein